MALKDRRRQDRRMAVHTQTPFWVKSAQLTIAEGNSDVVLVSFPFGPEVEARALCIHAAVVKVEEVFDGDASLIVGDGTIAKESPLVEATDSVTAVDADYYHVSADVTEATLGYYPASGSQFATDLGAGKTKILVGADTTTPVVYAKLTHTTSTKGKLRVLLLVSRVD